jgi:hypothetical protein
MPWQAAVEQGNLDRDFEPAPLDQGVGDTIV